MIPHLQIEKELASGELIDLTPGLFQRRMLYMAPLCSCKAALTRKVTDALLDYGHKVLRTGLIHQMMPDIAHIRRSSSFSLFVFLEPHHKIDKSQAAKNDV